MKEIEDLYQKHYKEKLRLYKEETCLYEILKNLRQINNLYNKREKVIGFINSFVPKILNLYIKGDKIKFDEKFTLRDNSIYKYRTNKELLVKDFVDKKFFEKIMERVSENSERVRELIEKLLHYRKFLDIDFDRRCYYTSVSNFDNSSMISKRLKKTEDLLLLYNIESDYKQREDRSRLSHETTEEEFFRTFQLNVRKEKYRSKERILNIPRNSRNYFELKKPEEHIKKNDLRGFVHYSEDMLFLSKRALKEIKTEMSFLTEIKELIEENFEKLVISKQI